MQSHTPIFANFSPLSVDFKIPILIVILFVVLQEKYILEAESVLQSAKRVAPETFEGLSPEIESKLESNLATEFENLEKVRVLESNLLPDFAVGRELMWFYFTRSCLFIVCLLFVCEISVLFGVTGFR